MTRRLLPTRSQQLSENSTTSDVTIVDDVTTAAKLGSDFRKSGGIMKVAKKSKNLSGHYVKALQETHPGLMRSPAQPLNFERNEGTGGGECTPLQRTCRDKDRASFS
ncbi:unnamed protein product [Euphydryas editha]|uniref:Uncharacterized protein n=1 Tax=Euphydryas editha TaxID=104508 RepID=A0AAU9TNV3_EUPED|nr:unnamed protein product [Euphydryas editha]